MGEKIVIGPKFGGLVNALKPFAITNETFPYLTNAYEWRGRIKRKRGTFVIGHLQRYTNSTNPSYGTPYSLTLDATGTATLLLPNVGLIVPGTVTITIGLNTYTDVTKNGYLTPTGTGGPNTINYAQGTFTIPSQALANATVSFVYNPDLPVMGLRGLNLNATQFPGTIAFDTTYSYNVTSTFPSQISDVSFYKNPPSGTYTGYTAKTNVTPLKWNGQNYQQFYTINHQNAMWALNGIQVPFSNTNIGMQFKPIVDITIDAAGPPAVTTIEITAHGLSIGDFLFINEVNGIPGINFQTGYVTDVVDVDNVEVTFPNASLTGAYVDGGIAQYLTNNANPNIDCIRWYDGNPSSGSATNPVLNTGLGWVNFCPPLSQGVYSIGDAPEATYYLVGARIVYPFKDRLLFFGPVIQTSAIPANPIYLQDTIIYSQVGTAFYTASFDAPSGITPSTQQFFPILTPAKETATPNAYWEDVTGFGGFLTAGYQQPITTVSPNEDVLIVGFNSRQSRLIYTGNDVIPFNLYIVNSELGSGSTFSAINLDRGVMTIGEHGFVVANQIGAERFDLDIPDAVFEINYLNNGQQRITAQRDFINEWIYFTYCSEPTNYIFPDQTLFYNYREQTWAVFNESYTTYGQFRHSTGLTWATIGEKYSPWSSWNAPWNSSASVALQPKVIAGTPQGYIVERDEGTEEDPTIYIGNISGSTSITNISNAANAVVFTNNTFVVGQTVNIMGVTGMTQINGGPYTIIATSPTKITLNVNSTAFGVYASGGTVFPTNLIYSPNHQLENGDYIVISGALGTVGANVNGHIYSVVNPTVNGFDLDPLPLLGTYLGGGQITRMYVPLVQSKQFNPGWSGARKVRLGAQQYLFTRTNNGQVTLLIFLSQNEIGVPGDAYNLGPIIPSAQAQNNTLVYSTILYTCPELTNLGLTPANINLQQVTATHQEQIWHRMNTSLLGDTVQVGFTLNDAQMRDTTFSNQFAEIELHCIVIDVSPSQLLA